MGSIAQFSDDIIGKKLIVTQYSVSTFYNFHSRYHKDIYKLQDSGNFVA